MTFLPILDAPFAVQVHVAAALTSLILGAYVLYSRRRNHLHKVLGYVWVTSMTVLAVASFAIPSHFTDIGIGPLHLFAVLTLWSLWTGVRHAIRRDFATHEAVFRSLYSNGLIIAGAFTFLPGRTVNRIVFGEPSQLGWLIIALVLVVAFVRVAGSRIARPAQP